MKSTIGLDIGISFLQQAVLPTAKARSRGETIVGVVLAIVWPMPTPDGDAEDDLAERIDTIPLPGSDGTTWSPKASPT